MTTSPKLNRKPGKTANVVAEDAHPEYGAYTRTRRRLRGPAGMATVVTAVAALAYFGAAGGLSTLLADEPPPLGSLPAMSNEHATSTPQQPAGEGALSQAGLSDYPAPAPPATPDQAPPGTPESAPTVTPTSQPSTAPGSPSPTAEPSPTPTCSCEPSHPPDPCGDDKHDDDEEKEEDEEEEKCPDDQDDCDSPEPPEGPNRSES